MAPSPFAKRTNWHSATNPLSQKLARLQADGAKVLDLTVSNPTNCQFKSFSESDLHALVQNENLVYEPHPQGLRAARDAVCSYYAEKGVSVNPEDVFITANTSEAYSFIFRLLMDPGSGLLAPAPSYPLIDYLAGLHDIEVSRYPLHEDVQWGIDFKQLEKKLRAPKIKALLTVNPNNPTGNFVSKADQEALTKALCARDVSLIADEVFFDFDNGTVRPLSFAATSEVLTFTLSGISKILGLPQMKLAWFVISGPEKFKAQARERLEIIADCYLSAGTPVQNALPQWLTQRNPLQTEILERLRNNQEFLTEQCGSLPSIKLFQAQGGWTAILKCPSFKADDVLAFEFLEEENVLVHPGYLFDFNEDRFVVLSLLVPEPVFREGVTRIRKRLSLAKASAS